MKKINTLCLIIFTSTFVYGQIPDNNQTSTDNLLNTTPISVTVGGDFPVTGSFPAYVSERVDQFITRLYLNAKEQSVRVSNEPRIISEIEEKLKDYSLRGIKLIRNSGETIHIDLLRFRVTGDFKYNPYLKNDDVLIFPSVKYERNFFTVLGAVNKPGIFFYVEGDSLKDAIELAMGVNDAYKNTGKITVSRLNYEGDHMQTDTLDINANIKINRGDQIKVLAPENLRKNYFVQIYGEVKQPGTYPITKNNTKLYDIIKSAGGFTEDASLRRAKIYSKNSLFMFLNEIYGTDLSKQPDLEDPRIRNTILNLETALMFRMSNVYPDDTTYFFLENQLRVLTEGSSFNFSRVEDTSSDISNYILNDREVIIIPAKQYSVYVFGQVSNPGYVPLSIGKDYKYYINEAGGMGDLAEEDDIMVIKGGSRKWISPIDNDVEVQEGDYIYVPKTQLRTFRSYAAEYGIYVQILSSIATVILLVITANK